MEGVGQMSGAGLLWLLTDVCKNIFIAVLLKIDANVLFGNVLPQCDIYPSHCSTLHSTATISCF